MRTVARPAGDRVPPAPLVTAPFVFLTAAAAYFAGVGLLLPAMARIVRDVMGASGRWVGLFAAAYSLAAVACRPALVRVTARRGERWLRRPVACSARQAAPQRRQIAAVDDLSPISPAMCSPQLLQCVV